VYSIPAVIDAPNQQGQDVLHLPKVLEFISKDLPHDMQLIVGSEKETEHSFDKTIVLSEPRGLLQEREFAEIKCVVAPMERAMILTLLKQDKSTLFSE
jgi:hypothetical protein